MTPRKRTYALAATLAGSLLLLALFLMNLELARGARRPADAEELARWVAAHPADWIAASALTDRSLDSTLPRRRELWRAAYGLAKYLAPLRPTTAEGFVRAGLFHWHELAPGERKAVLEAAAPLLRDPSNFAQLSRPLWQLTRDFAYLRRVAPPAIPALAELREISVAHGLFAEYRELRGALRAARMRELTARHAELQPSEIIALLPRHLDTADVPLVRAVLVELEQRAYEPQQVAARAAELAEFAIEQQVQPLSALEPLVDDPVVLPPAIRARLARALGKLETAKRIEVTNEAAIASASEAGKWTGLCGVNELCSLAALRQPGPLELTFSVTQSDEVAPYVEIYVDARLAAEGEIRETRTFTLAASPALHRFEVRLVNPRTRNGVQRRVRLS